MKGSYPIHPEVFDRLYQDWSTLERFQRTRGVLRLMAATIHELWDQGRPIAPDNARFDRNTGYDAGLPALRTLLRAAFVVRAWRSS